MFRPTQSRLASTCGCSNAVLARSSSDLLSSSSSKTNKDKKEKNKDKKEASLARKRVSFGPFFDLVRSFDELNAAIADPDRDIIFVGSFVLDESDFDKWPIRLSNGDKTLIGVPSLNSKSKRAVITGTGENDKSLLRIRETASLTVINIAVQSVIWDQFIQARDNCMVKIKSCKFSDGISDSGGYAVDAEENAQVEISDSLFINLKTANDSGKGAAIECDLEEKSGGQVPYCKITRCIFESCRARRGGALSFVVEYIPPEEIEYLTIKDCSFSNCGPSPLDDGTPDSPLGGALRIEVASTVKGLIENSEFINNGYNDDKGNTDVGTLEGGAIYFSIPEESPGLDEGGGTYTIRGCTFKNNGATERGGAIALTSALNLNVVKSKFIGNRCLQRYGAIGHDSDNASTAKSNLIIGPGCYFKSNVAGKGGAVGSDDRPIGKIEIFESDFCDNRAIVEGDNPEVIDGSGGAISIESQTVISDAETLIHHCTFKGNLAIKGGAVYETNYPATIEYSKFVANRTKSTSDTPAIYYEGSKDEGAVLDVISSAFHKNKKWNGDPAQNCLLKATFRGLTNLTEKNLPCS